MFGSHIDSVPEGGNYDGPVGLIGAIEVAQTLAENNIVTRHPLEVAVFQNEEGGKTGSRVLDGEFAERELDIVTASGRTIGEGIRLLGGDPTRLAEARRQPGDVAAFLELHVEQGAILDREQISIGVVEGIVGIKRWNVTVEGFANHAGTTPMDNRQDALLAAARFILAVNEVVTDMPGAQVGTVGRIQAEPGAPNVVPGRVVVSLEVRDLDMAKIDRIFQAVRAAGLGIGQDSGTTFAFDEFYVSRSAPTHERIRQLVQDAAAELGLDSRRMPSGAGHDAQSIARFAPIGMIFVPSVAGISHSPREFSRPEDIAAGVNVLLRTLLELDALTSLE
jgi:N-carbamoyl-L-amino-acid hydrolase